METPFQYVIVDRVLADTIASDLEAGRSIVVLGALGSGKYVLRRHVRATLEKCGADPIIEINFQQEPPSIEAREVEQRITAAAVRAGAKPVAQGDSLLGGLDGFAKCVYLLLESVDSLANHLIRQLLQELRERATRSEEAGRVVVLIAGEYDLRDFVHGPASEVTNFAARHYVLQGCDFECFDDFLRNDFRYTAVPLPDEPTRRLLWELSGGNADLMMAIVGASVWVCQRKGISPAEIRIDERLIDEVLTNGAQYGLSDVRLLRDALRLIPLEPEVWDSLDRLVQDQSHPLRFPVMRPAALTLSGLAKRKQGKLVFSCPIMAQAAQRFFNSRFFGDLYAQIGKWEKAFAYYGNLTPAERLRPLHGGDRRSTADVVQASKFSMEKMDLGGSGEVRNFFSKVCYFLLGFPQTFFLQQGNSRDLVLFPESSEHSNRAAAAINQTLKLVDSGRPGEEIPLPSPWTGVGFAWKLEGSEPGREIVAFVGDFDKMRLVNPEREKLLKELAEAFIKAHQHATDREAEQRRRSFRRTQNAVLSEVLRKLGIEIVDVEDALKTSAGRLRALGYRRIGFTLVDPTGQRVERVVDPFNLEGIPAKPWLLSEPGSGVHPFVIGSKQSLMVSNARDHPLADEKLVRECDIRAFAVVPILTGDKDAADTLAVGTIYVEREDHLVPSKGEVEDFEAFGQLLHSVMEQAQRVVLLQKSLTLTPEPHIIVDAQHRLRYVNDRAASLLRVRSGWRSKPVASGMGSEEGNKLAPLAADIVQALDREVRRVSHHEFRFPGDLKFKGSLVAAKIKDSLERTIGAFAHVEDLTYVYQVLNALDCVAKAHNRISALTAILEASRILGHQWARLYLVSAQDDDLLVSHAEFGLPPASEMAAQFESGEFKFRRSDRESEHAWRAMDEGEPVVFCYKKNNQKFRTPNGLVVHGTDHPGPPPFSKHLNALWMLAPLIASKKHQFGCISLECKEDLLPEHFHFLAVFFKLVSNLLDLHLSYESTAARLMELERDRATKVSLALVSHNLATRVAGFSPLIALYEDLESAAPAELAELNRLFRGGYTDVHSVLNRAKDVFRNAPLKLSRVDLFSVVDAVLQESLAGSTWNVVGERPIEADVDTLQLNSALKEVIKNSLDFSTPNSIAVLVDSEIVEGVEWVRIALTDEGPGVAEELKQRIFEDFFTHRPGRDPGTGLGLAVTRRVAELHGGRVSENGKPGIGARFVLEFPRFRKTRVILEDE